MVWVGAGVWALCLVLERSGELGPNSREGQPDFEGRSSHVGITRGLVCWAHSADLGSSAVLWVGLPRTFLSSGLLDYAVLGHFGAFPPFLGPRLRNQRRV